MNPIELARLAAGVLNVNNLSEENTKKANKILERALQQIDKLTMEANSGLIT